MENNNIPIEDHGTIEYENSFAPIKLKLNFKNKETDINYYLHKCDKIEYKELNNTKTTEEEVKDESEEALETVYFLNSNQVSETLQLNTDREEITDESSATEPNTLYFINEEESEP